MNVCIPWNTGLIRWATNARGNRIQARYQACLFPCPNPNAISKRKKPKKSAISRLREKIDQAQFIGTNGASEGIRDANQPGCMGSKTASPLKRL